MNPKLLKDLLAAHADRLVQGQAADNPTYHLSPEEETELGSLLGVAERIKTALKPVTPTSNFENKLKQQLLTTAYLHQVQGYRPPNPERDLLVLMGVIGFILSLAGVLVALRFRSQHS
jgi:hypothetical protein